MDEPKLFLVQIPTVVNYLTELSSKMFACHAVFIGIIIVNQTPYSLCRHGYSYSYILAALFRWSQWDKCAIVTVGTLQSTKHVTILEAKTVYQHQTVIQHHERWMSQTVMLKQYW